MSKDKLGRSISRRQLLGNTAKLGAAAAAMPLFNINHAWSKDVIYDGQPFDAKGATINIGEWGGFWEEFMRKNLLDQFAKDFNCKINYDSSFPWFPKYVAGGAKDPVNDINNWNLPEMFKTARAGDFFVSVDELKQNLPNASDCWDFAFDNGHGATWGFGQYCYAYRTDRVNPAPTSFKSFWEKRFDNKRGTYITSNTLFEVFFMLASEVYGSGQTDMKAGIDAMKNGMPMKISDFTGNMQTLLERGEVDIAVQWEGEVYAQADKGVPVAPYIWSERKPILTQTKTVSRYADPVSKKLAYALLDRTLDPGFQTKAAETFYLRPTNSKTVLPKNLMDKGVENTKDATADMWIPDWNWYLKNEADIVEAVNEIFAG